MTPITWDKREHGWFIAANGDEVFGPLPLRARRPPKRSMYSPQQTASVRSVSLNEKVELTYAQEVALENYTKHNQTQPPVTRA